MDSIQSARNVLREPRQIVVALALLIAVMVFGPLGRADAAMTFYNRDNWFNINSDETTNVTVYANEGSNLWGQAWGTRYWYQSTVNNIIGNPNHVGFDKVNKYNDGFDYSNTYYGRRDLRWEYKTKAGVNAVRDSNCMVTFRGWTWSAYSWQSYGVWIVLPPKGHFLSASSSPGYGYYTQNVGGQTRVVFGVGGFSGELNPVVTYWIDQLAPTTSMSANSPALPSGWRNADTTVSMSASDPCTYKSGVKELGHRVDNGSETVVAGSSASRTLAEGRHKVEVRAGDNDGNYSGYQQLQVKIDKTAPVSNAEIVTVSGVRTLMLLAFDPTLADGEVGSGVQYKEYRVNGGPWIRYVQGGMSLLGGESTIGFRAVDNANNIEAEKTINVNLPPVAHAAAHTTMEDTPITFQLGASDDAPIDQLTYHIDASPDNGTISLSGNMVTYTPGSNWSGQDRLIFHVTDSGGLSSNNAVVDLNVFERPDPPVALEDEYSTLEDNPIDINLRAIDVDSLLLRFRIVDYPVNGHLEGVGGDDIIIDGNHVIYVPNENYHGPDEFTFVVDDGTLFSNTAPITITINPDNDPPVASDVTEDTFEDTPVVVTLPASDVDGDDLSYRIVDDSGVVSGSLSDPVGNMVLYTPAADWNGSVQFKFVANDSTADSNVATATVDVVAVNDPPVARDMSIGTDEDTPVDGAFDVSDVDADDLACEVVSPPAHGQVTVTGCSFSYDPETNYNGPDSFTYKANDKQVDSGTATVNITVRPVNDPPVAEPGSAETPEDTPVTINLVASDIDGDDIWLEIVDDTDNGDLGQIIGKSIEYSPDLNYNGPDSFTFRVHDGYAVSEPATVSINVTPVNDAPDAADITLSISEDVSVPIMLQGTDVDGDPLTYSIVDDPGNGDADISLENQANYSPDKNYNGPDTFTYIVSDGKLSSRVATVTIEVTPVNDAPEASDVNVITDEDTAVAGNFDASDVDGDELSYSVEVEPTHGKVVVSGSGFTYTPEANYFGSDTFTYIANDGELDSNEAAVRITVNSVNDAPAVNNVAAATDEDTPVTGLFDGSDIESDPLSFSIESEPSHGSVVIDGSGFTYTPVANYNGSDSFTYKANDGDLDSNTGTVEITVRPVNDSPYIGDEISSVTVNEGSAAKNSGTWSDVDTGDEITLSSSIGTVTGNGTGSGSWAWMFLALDGPADSQQVTVNASDGEATDSEEFDLTVNNVAPAASAITGPLDPVQITSNAVFSAEFSDQGVLDTHTAAWEWGDGESSDASVTEVAGSGSAAGTHAYSTPGVYTVKLVVTDKDGDSDSEYYRYVVVYDPSGGHVSGGGWINSPVGAYLADATLTGKATFGFVSGYKRGATVPTGNTEFQFQTAKLTFKSTSYDWLVVSGMKAKYKGTGTINGAGAYSFMLSLIDGVSTGPDRFRMKIWSEGGVVYDNELGNADDADASTAISGGSIVVHKTK